jgi:hypothetical protein
MKKLRKLLSVSILGIALLTSCEIIKKDVPESYTFTFDGIEYKDPGSTEYNFFSNRNLYGIHATFADKTQIVIDVPEINATIWTRTADKDTVIIWLYFEDEQGTRTDYSSSFGELSDYSVSITKVDSKDDVVEGTFSGILGRQISMDEYEYKEITNGKFKVQFED